MGDIETKQPLTITARRVAILPVQHQMGAVEWMRKSEEDKASLLASVRAFAVNQADEAFPGCLYAFLPPEVDTSKKLTIAGDQTIDRGCTITAPVFVFEPVVQDVHIAADDRMKAYLDELNKLTERYGFALTAGTEDRLAVESVEPDEECYALVAFAKTAKHYVWDNQG